MSEHEPSPLDQPTPEISDNSKLAFIDLVKSLTEDSLPDKFGQYSIEYELEDGSDIIVVRDDPNPDLDPTILYKVFVFEPLITDDKGNNRTIKKVYELDGGEFYLNQSYEIFDDKGQRIPSAISNEEPKSTTLEDIKSKPRAPKPTQDEIDDLINTLKRLKDQP